MSQTAHQQWCDRAADQQLWASLIQSLTQAKRLAPRGSYHYELQRALSGALTAAEVIQRRIQSPHLFLGLREASTGPAGMAAIRGEL